MRLAYLTIATNSLSVYAGCLVEPGRFFVFFPGALSGVACPVDTLRGVPYMG